MDEQLHHYIECWIERFEQILNDIAGLMKRTTGKVTESIFSNKNQVIPMAEVSHIVKLKDQIEVVFKHSKWNDEFQHYDPSVHLGFKSDEGEKFLKAWCNYRSELESESLMPMNEFIEG